MYIRYVSTVVYNDLLSKQKFYHFNLLCRVDLSTLRGEIIISVHYRIFVYEIVVSHRQISNLVRHEEIFRLYRAV